MAIGLTRNHFRIPTIGLKLQIDMRDLGGHIGLPGSKLDLAPMKKHMCLVLIKTIPLWGWHPANT